jgi:L-iditol 2-dehydrogenase
VRAARYHAPRDVRIEDVQQPDPGPGEIRLRVRNCSVCGTDLKIYQHGHHAISPPRVLGHEIAGEVAAVGEAVTGWAVGDRVQVIAAIPCGQCAACRRGWPTVCEDRETIGYHYDGGFAQHFIVPAKVLAVAGVNRITDGTGFAEASVAEPLACVLNGQELVRVGTGDGVVVVGAGPVGCLHVRLARLRGAGRVFLVDLNRQRLDRAAELVRPDDVICAGDADVVGQVLGLTRGRGADVVITAAASAVAQQQAVRCAARRGRVSLFGGLPEGARATAIDTNLVHYGELTLVGATSSSPAQNAKALDLIASGALPVADLITHRLPLDRFAEALDLVARGDAIKVTIEP